MNAFYTRSKDANGYKKPLPVEYGPFIMLQSEAGKKRTFYIRAEVQLEYLLL